MGWRLGDERIWVWRIGICSLFVPIYFVPSRDFLLGQMSAGSNFGQRFCSHECCEVPGISNVCLLDVLHGPCSYSASFFFSVVFKSVVMVRCRNGRIRRSWLGLDGSQASAIRGGSRSFFFFSFAAERRNRSRGLWICSCRSKTYCFAVIYGGILLFRNMGCLV